MAKSYKLKDNNYIDTQSIVHNKQTLDIIIIWVVKNAKIWYINYSN